MNTIAYRLFGAALPALSDSRTGVSRVRQWDGLVPWRAGDP